MNDNFAIQLFEGKKVRIVWDAEKEKYYFAVADIVQVLTDSEDVKQYIKRMRARDPELNSRWGTICTPTRMMAADGKVYKTQAADLEGIFRIIQSIPSKKAEPVKKWLAEVGAQRIDQMIDPELSFQMAVEDYRRQGYSDRWINERMRSIEMRKELTDEWHRSGIHEPKDWNKMIDLMADGYMGPYYADKYYMLDDNFNNSSTPVTRMFGTSSRPFTGTFDGNAKTLTVDINSNEEGAAPFHYIDGASIESLYVYGTVNSSANYAAGLVASTNPLPVRTRQRPSRHQLPVRSIT